MRLSLSLVSATLLSISGLWAQVPEPIKLGSVIVTGSVRTRLESWEWFTPDTGDPSYSFLGSQLRLNFTRPGKALDWTIELGAPILLGLPENAIATGVQGQ